MMANSPCNSFGNHSSILCVCVCVFSISVLWSNKNLDCVLLRLRVCSLLLGVGQQRWDWWCHTVQRFRQRTEDLSAPARVRLSLTRNWGAVQWLHWTQTQLSDLPGPHVLPASEAHGGRQDPLASPWSFADSQPTTHGRSLSVCLSVCLCVRFLLLYLVQRTPWGTTRNPFCWLKFYSLCTFTFSFLFRFYDGWSIFVKCTPYGSI